MKKRKNAGKDNPTYQLTKKSERELEVCYEKAFQDFYPDLLYYAMQFLEQEEAEDLVQDAFMELWKQRYAVEFNHHIHYYLYRLLYNKIINAINHNKVKGKYLDAQKEINEMRIAYYDSNYDNILKKIETRELEVLINQAIEELPKQCRQVFKMSYLQEMKNKEIAAILDVSLRTVEAHMYKALKILRNKLKNISLFITLI